MQTANVDDGVGHNRLNSSNKLCSEEFYLVCVFVQFANGAHSSVITVIFFKTMVLY